MCSQHRRFFVLLSLMSAPLLVACTSNAAPEAEDSVASTEDDATPSRNVVPELPDVIVAEPNDAPHFDEVAPFERPEWALWSPGEFDDVEPVVQITDGGDSGGGASPTGAVYIPAGLPTRDDLCAGVEPYHPRELVDPNNFPVRADLSVPMPGAVTDRPLRGRYDSEGVGVSTDCGIVSELEFSKPSRDIDLPYPYHVEVGWSREDDQIRRHRPTFDESGTPDGFWIPHLGVGPAVWVPVFNTNAEITIEASGVTWSLHILHAQGGSSAVAIVEFSAVKHRTWSKPSSSGVENWIANGVFWIRMSEKDARLHVESRTYFDLDQYDDHVMRSDGTESYRKWRDTWERRRHYVFYPD